MGVEPRLLSVPELSHHLAESYLTCRLYLQETLQYKRQHHLKVSRLALRLAASPQASAQERR